MKAYKFRKSTLIRLGTLMFRSDKHLFLKVTSGILPAILPPLHIIILYYFWQEYGRRVNREYCSCSCWDTIFKGTYESGVASYKHFYFNATSNTMKIWVFTVTFILILYETSKRILSLVFEGRVRYLMSLLFASSIFAHYYAWWVCVNYWNDEFYLQWNHQLFFTVTEFISTAFVVHLCDSRKALTSKKVIVVVSIAIVHILAGSLDQFVNNVVYKEGHAHQIIRDLSFMIPDVLHVLFPIIELVRSKKDVGLINRCDTFKDMTLMLCIILGGFAFTFLV